MGLSTVGCNNALDGALGRVTQTARTIYAVCLTATPTKATTLATMTEAAGTTRQACAVTAPTGDPALTSNVSTLSFPFTADPASITYVALVSAASGTSGDFLGFALLTTARDPANGDVLEFLAGEIDFTLS